MLSIFLTLTIIHSLTGTNFDVFSRTLYGNTATLPVCSDKKLNESQTTTQNIINGILNKVEIFLQIMRLYNVSIVDFNRKF